MRKISWLRLSHFPVKEYVQDTQVSAITFTLRKRGERVFRIVALNVIQKLGIGLLMRPL